MWYNGGAGDGHAGRTRDGIRDEPPKRGRTLAPPATAFGRRPPPPTRDTYFMRILGIDPGLKLCGYGVIDHSPSARAWWTAA